MKGKFWSVLVAGVITAAAVVTATWHFMTQDASPTQPGLSTAGTKAQSGAANEYASLWSGSGKGSAALSDGSRQGAAGAMDADRMRANLQANPALMRDMVKRYEAEANPRERAAMKAMLSTINDSTVVDLSKRLVVDKDPQKRREGLQIMREQSAETVEMRSTVKQLLAAEKDPAVLVEALRALRQPLDAAEAREVSSYLLRLSQHPDAAVRSESISRLGQWGHGLDSGGRLAQALTDQVAEVRQAAVLAISQSQYRSPDAKGPLFNIANDPNESRNLRLSALQALELYSPNAEEMAGYAQMRTQILNN